MTISHYLEARALGLAMNIVVGCYPIEIFVRLIFTTGNGLIFNPIAPLLSSLEGLHGSQGRRLTNMPPVGATTFFLPSR
jgi:hypothetical protein